jgi:hypothetical protein
MSTHNVTVCEQHINWNVVISSMKIIRCQNVGVTFAVNSSFSRKQMHVTRFNKLTCETILQEELYQNSGLC